MRTVRAAILLLSGMLLAGCFSDSTSNGAANVGPTDPTSGNGAPATPATASGFRPQFEPLNGILPYPNDLYFSGSTDGTLNLPINPFQPTAATINQLDGFSTNGYMSVRFAGGAIDPATLTAASMRVIRLTLDNSTKAPSLPPSPGAQLPQVLTFGTDYTASVAAEPGSAGGTLIIRPTKPLTPSAGAVNFGYLVLLTEGIHSSTGALAVPDTDYKTVRDQAIKEIQAGATTPTCTPITNATLNAICRLTFAHLRVGAGFAAVNPTSVVVSFGFSTESTGDTLAAVTQIIAASPAPVLSVAPVPGPSGTLNTHDINPLLPGAANIYAGTLRVPYYLSAPSAAAPTAPVTRFWTAAGPPAVPTLDQSSRNLTRFNPVPAKTADLDIPIIVMVPRFVPPPWPVAIFQHGLTRNRTDAIFISDAFGAPPPNGAGFVVVSIDLPLHGLTPTNPLSPLFRQAGKELTFDLDVSNNTTLAPGPDGVVDGSGQNFVNLSSLLTTRDNLRQGAVDLLALTRALATLDLTGDGTPDLIASRIHFVGHSLGSIVGGVYATFGANARTASLLNTGGGVAQTIVDSPAFGPAINAALTAQGLIPGTTLYNQFLRDAQTAADAGDPVNYIATLLAAKPVHITQVVGSTGWLPDQVVPNSSTQRMITAGGAALRRVSTTSATAAGNGAYVNFLFGHHGSIIDPSCSNPPVGPDPAKCAAVTTEMQRETVAFAAADGAAVTITDTSVVQP
jgi:hypothetical protein